MFSEGAPVEYAWDPRLSEAQRREFFAQLHRWGRQGHRVHVFCNNDGERERFGQQGLYTTMANQGYTNNFDRLLIAQQINASADVLIVVGELRSKSEGMCGCVS